MNFKETIEYLKKGTKHYNLIVVNQESKKCINECRSIKSKDITKINLNQKLLNDLLIGKSQEEKEYETWDYVKSFLKQNNSKIIILYDVEYLFSPELGNLDVINNLKYYSRNGQIVILFIKGKIIDNHLIYSEEGYADYRNMDISEVNIVGW